MSLSPVHLNINRTKVFQLAYHQIQLLVISFYPAISLLILLYLIDRTQSQHIKHLGPTAKGLYIKDMEGSQPQWAQTFITPRKHKKKGKRDIIAYLVCQDEATLVNMINLGSVAHDEKRLIFR